MEMRACQGHGARTRSLGRRRMAMHMYALCGVLSASVFVGLSSPMGLLQLSARVCCDSAVSAVGCTGLLPALALCDVGVACRAAALSSGSAACT